MLATDKAMLYIYLTTEKLVAFYIEKLYMYNQAVEKYVILIAGTAQPLSRMVSQSEMLAILS
jgi:hypothetical protein